MKGRSIAEVLAGALVLLVTAGFLVFALTNSGRSALSGPGVTLQAKFDRIDGLAPGADVRIAGVKVGSVVGQRIDPVSFLAVLTLRVDGTLRLPSDTSAEIASEGLLGGSFVQLVPGAEDKMLAAGGQIKYTQAPVNLVQMLGKFMFNSAEGAGQGAAPKN